MSPKFGWRRFSTAFVRAQRRLPKDRGEALTQDNVSNGSAMNMHSSGLRIAGQRRLICRLVFLMLLALPAVLLSQAYFGTVSGVIKDSAGAVIPGVNLTLTDVGKGYTFTARSNKVGEFLLPSIPPSTYNLTAEMSGFDKDIRTNIVVSVTGHVTANLTLKVASAAQT